MVPDKIHYQIIGHVPTRKPTPRWLFRDSPGSFPHSFLSTSKTSSSWFPFNPTQQACPQPKHSPARSRKNNKRTGTLILSSLLEDLVAVFLVLTRQPPSEITGGLWFIWGGQLAGPFPRLGPRGKPQLISPCRGDAAVHGEHPTGAARLGVICASAHLKRRAHLEIKRAHGGCPLPGDLLLQGFLWATGKSVRHQHKLILLAVCRGSTQLVLDLTCH